MINPAATFLPAALLIILLPLLSSAAHPPPVLDTHGKPLHTGAQYYILPAAASTHYGGGGLTLGRTSNHNETSCQLGVFQDKKPSSLGLLVAISPAAGGGGDVHGPTTDIPTATDVSIKFAASTTCLTTTMWMVDRFDRDAKKWFVLTGGDNATSGGRTASQNLFKIVEVVQRGKHVGLFKIVFCPSVCEGCHVACKDVGVFVDGKSGDRRLALVDHGPFLVQFKKA